MKKEGAHVELGAEEKDGKYVPTIEIHIGDETLRFVCDQSANTIETARDICIGVFEILSGKKKNVEVFPDGKIKERADGIH